MVLGVIVGDISVPLLWHILPKAGCSDTEERAAIFDCFFALAPLERIAYLLADRECIGQEWFTFLQRTWLCSHWLFSGRIVLGNGNTKTSP
ncbi:MAG: hypothetical protein EAZ92_04490 [Candidatus Kapaibacterium sp.]|nr:MAG: hypothetical protein EAZ92_04490 [Candidatus Kapabacteria bacterium]